MHIAPVDGQWGIDGVDGTAGSAISMDIVGMKDICELIKKKRDCRAGSE